jgi:hydrogenase maturation protein HypF
MERVAEVSEYVRRRLIVRGIVQGVGFRPYAYRLARTHHLAGFVRNTALGAVIEIEGDLSAVEAFEGALPDQGPPMMIIDSMEAECIAPHGDEEFRIVASDAEGPTLAWVPADIASCELCLGEMNDAADRRYGYPFINCTNCGPRYSITLGLPYDRAQTTMAAFTMCDACREEYEDPESRRFHAQPNACPACGPQLSLTDACGSDVPVRGTDSILKTVANLLGSGGIAAWKGLGGYQLACDARNANAVAELRKRKHRNEKAFAVMVEDITTAEIFCEVSESERSLLSGASKPIVLLKTRETAKLPEAIAPGSSLLGVMLPYTPMHALLFRAFHETGMRDAVLVMTSGNVSEEPIVTDEAEAHERLRGIADIFVDHNRPIHTRVDDSVARVVEGRPFLLRRARGYAPMPMELPVNRVPLLACGAQQKSTLCFAREGVAFLSQHLGDLENYETLVFFEQTLERMGRLLQIEPEAVAHDLHPAYLSTQLAQRLPIAKKFAVQHHHAHIASCMAEHRLEGPVIGVAWDGTGLGTDGTIWGGEFLLADYAGFERQAHLRSVPLAGGDTAVREPWRVARSYLLDAFDNSVPRGIRWQNFVLARSVRTLDALLEGRIRTTDTSSCGRLFDAVASLLGVHQAVSFEGQAAMALETIAGADDKVYDFALDGARPSQVDLRCMVRQIVDDVEREVPASTISARFHNTLVAVIEKVCIQLGGDTGNKRVCLSGGCFQNVRLLEGCLRALRFAGFEVFFQQQIPCNDGGISLGQAAIASELLRKGM